MRKPRKPRKPHQRKGAVAVEFALTAPVLFLILFACIELGLANMMFHTTEAAAYEAARAAIVPGATAAEVTQIAQQTLGTAGIRVATISVAPADLSLPTETVNVTISANFRDNIPLTPFFVRNQPMVKTCVLQRELVD